MYLLTWRVSSHINQIRKLQLIQLGISKCIKYKETAELSADRYKRSRDSSTETNLFQTEATPRRWWGSPTLRPCEGQYAIHQTKQKKEKKNFWPSIRTAVGDTLLAALPRWIAMLMRCARYPPEPLFTIAKPNALHRYDKTVAWNHCTATRCDWDTI